MTRIVTRILRGDGDGDGDKQGGRLSKRGKAVRNCSKALECPQAYSRLAQSS